MRIHLMSGLVVLGALITSVGCALPAEETEDPAVAPPSAPEESVGEVASEIVDGSPGTTFLQQRVVAIDTPILGSNPPRVGSCTGVIIGPKHVLTASHCLAAAGRTLVRFYNGSNTPVGARGTGGTLVSQVILKPDVHPDVEDFSDTEGNFADFAILVLPTTIPATSRVAFMAMTYAGEDKAATEAGRGAHDGVSNGSDQLRFAPNSFFSSSWSSGYFYMNDQRTNKGDSGSAVFANNKVHGVLFGEAWVPFGWRDKYTSTGFYLPFILAKMAYTTTSLVLPNTMLAGGAVLNTTFLGDLRTCEYSCDSDSACHGFTFFNSICTTRSTLSNTTVTTAGAVSGVR